MSILFHGRVLPLFQHNLLVYGTDAGALGEPAFGPPVRLSLAYRLYARPDYLLLADTIDDVGRRMHPPESYEWIEAHGHLFPRADAIGQLANGTPESVFIKELDLADAAAYASHSIGTAVRISLAIEALAIEDGLALGPVSPPPELALFGRVVPFYRLSPGIYGALGAAILQQLLATGRRDWRLTFDHLDDFIEW
jgi:hypothetical protein